MKMKNLQLFILTLGMLFASPFVVFASENLTCGDPSVRDAFCDFNSDYVKLVKVFGIKNHDKKTPIN